MTSYHNMQHSGLKYESRQFRQFAVLKEENMKPLVHADIATAQAAVPRHALLSGHTVTASLSQLLIYSCNGLEILKKLDICFAFLCLFCFALTLVFS